MIELPVIIPALNPDEKLIILIKNLISNSEYVQKIIVVNDGSTEEYDHIFSYIEKNFDVTILKHQINRGKGRALKTAIDYVIKYLPNSIGIITIDSDGQHTIEDMKKCIKVFLEQPNVLLLGTRSFDNDVPLRSKVGNILTAKFTRFTIGENISDTQTGLRVIPKKYFQKLLSIHGERFEFEMNMILEAKNNGICTIEVPIETIYLEENKSSHFRVIRDSLSIYKLFMKYIVGAITSFGIDIFIFTLLVRLLSSFSIESVLVASVLARISSSLFNYSINKKIIFQNGNDLSLLGYYILAVIQVLLSTILVTIVHELIAINISVLKSIVDGLLFIFSYQVQKKIIFKGEQYE